MSDPIESRLLRLSAEGTQGEWVAENVGFAIIKDRDGYGVAMSAEVADRDRIVAAVNALPALCAVVAAARATVDPAANFSERSALERAEALTAALAALDAEGRQG